MSSTVTNFSSTAVVVPCDRHSCCRLCRRHPVVRRWAAGHPRPGQRGRPRRRWGCRTSTRSAPRRTATTTRRPRTPSPARARRARPPGPDHRRAAARQRGVRRPRAGPARPAADHGRCLPAPAPATRRPATRWPTAATRSAREPATSRSSPPARHLPALQRATGSSRGQQRRRAGPRPEPGRGVDGPQGRQRLHLHASAVATSPRAADAHDRGSRRRFRARRGPRAALAYPEADVNINGDPHAGVTPYQEVRGYVDAHTHGMAFEFLGGKVHCGRPWHEYGAPYALVDCPDHELTQGNGAILESFLSGERQPRPGRLADVQGLAGAELADPRGHLLPVARALLARRAAALRQPAGREQQALPALPAQAQLLRRHGLDPPAGARHVRVPGLHRRPVRRPGQGLLPDREDAVRRRARSSTPGRWPW